MIKLGSETDRIPLRGTAPEVSALVLQRDRANSIVRPSKTSSVIAPDERKAPDARGTNRLSKTAVRHVPRIWEAIAAAEPHAVAADLEVAAAAGADDCGGLTAAAAMTAVTITRLSFPKTPPRISDIQQLRLWSAQRTLECAGLDGALDRFPGSFPEKVAMVAAGARVCELQPDQWLGMPMRGKSLINPEQG
jgi:hypothetical protein